MIKHCVRRSHGSRTAVKRTENGEQEERQADECVDHAGACPGAIDDAGEAGRCGGGSLARAFRPDFSALRIARTVWERQHHRGKL